MVRAISVIVIGTLLAGPFAATAAAKPFVDANADGGIVSTDEAVGSNMEALGRRDTADARRGQDLVAGGPEDDGATGGPADQAGRIIVRYARGADVGETRANVLDGVEGARSLEVLSTANAEVFAARGPVRDAMRAAEEVPGVRYAEESQRGFRLFSPDDALYERGRQWAPKKTGAEKAWESRAGT